MSDGGGGAPAGGAAPAAAPTGGAQQGGPPAAAAKPPEAPSWSEKDDADLIERLKKSPYGKRKVNGKEETISSKDDFQRWILDSQRGVGANRVVEEARKKEEAAQQASAELEKLRSSIERLKKGDRAALRDLGLEDGNEAEQQRQAMAQLPPEVRQAIEYAQGLEAQLREVKEAEAKRLQAEKDAQAKQQRDAVLSEAKEAVKTLLAEVDPSKFDAELPEMVEAIQRLKSQGLKFGRDYTPEQLKLYVSDLREQNLWGRWGNVKADVRVSKAAPLMVELAKDPAALKAALGDNFVPIAKAVAKLWREHHAVGTPQAQPAQQKQEEPAQPIRKPLSPMRW